MIPIAVKTGGHRKMPEEIIDFVDVRCPQESGCSAMN
jgi:hypothetical protein